MKKNHRTLIHSAKFIKLLLVALLLFALSACASEGPSIDTSIPPEEEMQLCLASADYEKAVVVYNKRIHETELEDQFNEKIMSCITTTVTSWANLELDYVPAAAILEKLAEINNPEIAAYASEQQNLVTIEGKGSELLLQAQEAFDTDKYIEAMQMISEISTDFSQYDVASELYGYSKDIILAFIENPASVAEFEEGIKQLKDYLKIIDEPAFSERLSQLESEVVIFKDIEKITEEAQALYSKGSIGEAFAALEAGLSKYPGNSHMQENFQTILDLFIINTTTKVKAACEEKEYKEALSIVNAAIAEYDCEELQELLIFVKEEKNFLFKLKNNIVEAVTSFKESWEQEDMTVKEAGSRAGAYIAYIMKSGKKILLGDYTDEEVTVLSCGGNVVASIANLDMLFDIRDLTYDIQNWGEGEYFVARLAVDTIALIPVVGMVKYLKYADAATDTAKALENISDIAKVSDSVSDAAKTADNIGDAVGAAKVLSKTSEVTGQTIKTRLGIKPYTYVKTKNAALVDSVHDATGVGFVKQQLKYSDGKMICGVFPQFDSAADIRLNKDLYKASFADQKKFLNAELQRKVQRGDRSLLSKFNDDELKIIAEGKLPDGYTWHHNEKEGLMQLVDADTHKNTGHTGGMSLWGGGHSISCTSDAAA